MDFSKKWTKITTKNNYLFFASKLSSGDQIGRPNKVRRPIFVRSLLERHSTQRYKRSTVITSSAAAAAVRRLAQIVQLGGSPAPGGYRSIGHGRGPSRIRNRNIFKLFSARLFVGTPPATFPSFCRCEQRCSATLGLMSAGVHIMHEQTSDRVTMGHQLEH